MRRTLASNTDAAAITIEKSAPVDTREFLQELNYDAAQAIVSGRGLDNLELAPYPDERKMQSFVILRDALLERVNAGSDLDGTEQLLVLRELCELTERAQLHTPNTCDTRPLATFINTRAPGNELSGQPREIEDLATESCFAAKDISLSARDFIASLTYWDAQELVTGTSAEELRKQQDTKQEAEGSAPWVRKGGGRSVMTAQQVDESFAKLKERLEGRIARGATLNSEQRRAVASDLIEMHVAKQDRLLGMGPSKAQGQLHSVTAFIDSCRG